MQISSRFPTAQDLIKQLEDSLSQRDQRPAEAGLTPPVALPVSDSFETSPVAADATEAADQQQESGGLRISYHFDLFYQLSQKVQARMGQSGQERFVETTSSVAETFKTNFSLKIDAVGSFLKGTDSSLNISNETANEFFDAVEGLSELSPEALETFLKESGEFFDELENTYGEADGAFDDIKAVMQQQAKAFFDGVKTVRGETDDAAVAEAVPALTEPATEAEADPAALKIKLAVGPQQNAEVSGDQYQEFIDSFLEYMRRYRETFLSSMLGGKQPAENAASPANASEKPSKSAEASAQTPAVDNGQYPILPNTPNGKFPSGYFFSIAKSTSVFARFDSAVEKPEAKPAPPKLDTSA